MALDEAQVRRATSALLKHVKISTAAKPSLLEEGEVILAQISLHKIPDKVTAKPHRIEIPHPLRQQDDCDMCLFVKDNAKAWIKEMIEKEPVAGLAKIIKLQKLRTQYHEFKDRRQLLSQYDLFLADDRILPMLTKALGKVFLKVKKQPIPIGLERRSSLAKQIAQARKSAFLCGSHGDCWSVKLANIVMTEDQVVENLMAGLTAVVDKIPRKWKNVKAINIKTSKSIALPVYSNVGDIPPTLTSEAMEVAAPVEVTVELDGKASRNTTGKTKKTNKNTKADGSDKSDRTRKSVVNEKVRKPRPLIRQQLRRIKEETKAEKESTAPDTTNSAENGKGSRKGNRKSTDEEIRGTENNSLQVGKKRASSENAETTSAKGQREEMRKHGHDRRNEKESTKVKRKSPALTSPVARKARGGKRRKAEVE